MGVHSAKANEIANAALARRLVPSFAHLSVSRREVKLADDSRIDFELTSAAAPAPPVGGAEGGSGAQQTVFVEVKSVTLAAEGAAGVAVFPDTESTRALRHITVLHEVVLKRTDARGAALFVVQRPDCDAFAPAWAHDPLYSAVLTRAHSAGMPIHAIRCGLAWNNGGGGEAPGYVVELLGTAPFCPETLQPGAEELARVRPGCCSGGDSPESHLLPLWLLSCGRREEIPLPPLQIDKRLARRMSPKKRKRESELNDCDAGRAWRVADVPWPRVVLT